MIIWLRSHHPWFDQGHSASRVVGGNLDRQVTFLTVGRQRLQAKTYLNSSSLWNNIRLFVFFKILCMQIVYITCHYAAKCELHVNGEKNARTHLGSLHYRFTALSKVWFRWLVVVVISFTHEEFVSATAERVTEQGDRVEIHITVRAARLTGAGKIINQTQTNTITTRLTINGR